MTGRFCALPTLQSLEPSSLWVPVKQSAKHTLTNERRSSGPSGADSACGPPAGHELLLTGWRGPFLSSSLPQHLPSSRRLAETQVYSGRRRERDPSPCCRRFRDDPRPYGGTPPGAQSGAPFWERSPEGWALAWRPRWRRWAAGGIGTRAQRKREGLVAGIDETVGDRPNRARIPGRARYAQPRLRGHGPPNQGRQQTLLAVTK
jgi:hypothetical protein